jgi:FecR protein/Outer membrane lipoprotein
MSRAPLDSEPGELLRRLAQENIPSDPDDGSPARRDRLVRGMKDAVERAAESAEKTRRFRRGAGLVAAAAGFLLLSGLLLKQYHASGGPSTIAGLDRVSGTVVLTQEGARRVVGSGERALRDGDGLQTAAGAHAHLLTTKSSVNVNESTELRLSRPSAAEERISLRRGRVDVSVDKAVETKRAVVVETPDAEVVVRGTVFDVRVEPLQTTTNTHVHVTRGSVWVLAQGVQVALLSAGQSWSSLGGIEAAEARPAALPKSAATEPEAAPSPVTAKLAAATSKGAAPRKPGTLAEENRLFAAGVEARNRGDAPRAAELFAELLATYPQSTLREVAQVERFRALSSGGQTARAAGEARRYLAEHPDGAARNEARDLALDSQK